MVRDEAVLLDIVRAAQLALEFRQDMDKLSFFGDLKTQSAILHQLTSLHWKAGTTLLTPILGLQVKG